MLEQPWPQWSEKEMRGGESETKIKISVSL